MNTAVFLIHLLVVFGVPFIFGWVLLRRVFREANWLTLLPAAVIIGVVALMTIVNELRFTMEMHPALWFAYKLLLGLTLLMLVALRAPGSACLPRSANHQWQLALLGLGALAVAVYYGIPAFNGYLNDSWWYHYPAAVQIQTAEFFPLHGVFALDETLYYHYGPDILAASWASLLDCSVQTGFALNIVVFAPCAFLLAFALLSRLTRSYWSSLLGASFLIAGGNLRFLQLLLTKPAGAIGALQVLNSQSVQGLQQLMFTPSHALGIPLVLTLLLLFRHIVTRPSFLGAGVFGLLLGALTMVAEWYFLPLICGIVLVLAAGSLGWIRQKSRLAVTTLVPVAAIACGIFNHTYLAGLFEHFWMPFQGIEQLASVRQVKTAFQSASGELNVPIFQPTWKVPDLVPVRINISHFGQVPSWEAAASADSTFIPILGSKFLMEITPVMLCGIPFGIWLAWKRRQPIVILLVLLAVTSAIPPVLLDWGYRSTDFLRFFTASFCFSALFLGWLAGDLLSAASWRRRLLGGVLAVACLINPVALGVIGLMPGTLATVKNVADTAQSLSQASTASGDGRSALPGSPKAAPPGTFEKLATSTGNYLFALTQGRERTIVIVPTAQVPEVKYFPEWMKMATIGRFMLPVGWHWQNSLYSAFYLDAVTHLDARAIAALDARWVVASNLFQKQMPDEVSKALLDESRFAPVARFSEGTYFMTLYKVRP